MDDAQSTEQIPAPLSQSPATLPPIQVSVTGLEEAGARVHLMGQPFIVIGRSPDCDIRLNDERVSYRHAYLQRIGGRVLCVDLCSRTGVTWEDGPSAGNWLLAGRTARIGTYALRLQGEAAESNASAELPTDYNPLETHAAGQMALPDVHLEVLQGIASVPRWPLDRMLTLIGRSKGCTLRLKNDSLSSVHCSLLLMKQGLFVIDLLGRGGTRVDGNPTRYARLEDGAILEIGDFRLCVHLEQQPFPESPPALPGTIAPVPVTTVLGTESHKVFRLEQRGATLIVTILGDAPRFHYADVQRESNTVRFTLQKPQIANVVIDFAGGDIISSVSIAAVMAIARTATKKEGRAILCRMNQRTADLLATRQIHEVWPCVATREDAFAALDA